MLPNQSRDPTSLINELRQSYSSSALLKENAWIIYGSSGAGKTFSLRTARKPVFIDSFDPGGSAVMADLVEKGQALVVTEYEDEDAERPTAFERWDRNFDNLVAKGMFDKLGTYVIDSATTWATAALNVVLKNAKRAGQVPQQNDWYPQMNLMEKALRRVLSVPCDVILVCHDDVLKDEVEGKIMRAPLLTGKSKKRIPILFGEIYYADTHQTSRGPEYIWNIAKTSRIDAKSRIAGVALTKGIKIDGIIPQDFQALMAKARRDYKDLPNLW